MLKPIVYNTNLHVNDCVHKFHIRVGIIRGLNCDSRILGALCCGKLLGSI